jgi:hypothetical protein
MLNRTRLGGPASPLANPLLLFPPIAGRADEPCRSARVVGSAVPPSKGGALAMTLHLEGARAQDRKARWLVGHQGPRRMTRRGAA